MSYERAMLAGLIPVGFQKMSLTNSTATAVNSTIQTARVLRISVETAAARYRMDGTSPTTETGVRLAPDILYTFYGYNGTSALEFVKASGSCTVSIEGYKAVGD